MGKAHNTKAFRMYRHVVLWLHDYKCFLCKKQTSAIHVHHIDKINTHNSFFNLIPLCHYCHKIIHRADTLRQVSKKEIITLLLRKIEYFSRL